MSHTTRLTLSFTNIPGPYSNFVECESFLKSNSPDILTLCETTSDDSINSKGLCYSYGWSCSLCEGREGLIPNTLGILTCVFDWLYFIQCLLFFLLSITFFVFMYSFDVISSNIDEVLWINHLLMCLSLETSVHRKAWLTYSYGTDRPCGLCYNFSISNDFTQMVIFVIRIPDCDSHICSFGYIYFFWR